ncbi:hypothetical protein [Eisenbergiella sp.]
MPIMMAAAEGTIDTGLVTEVVTVTKSVMGLFTEYPMNIFIIGSIVILALGIFVKARKAAH